MIFLFSAAEPLSDVGTASGAVKKASNFTYLKDAGDNIKVEGSYSAFLSYTDSGSLLHCVLQH